MGDTRTDPGQYYPGGRVVSRRDVAPPQIVVQWSDVQGKPQIAPLSDRYREDDMKGKINEIASKFATALAVALVGWTAFAGVTVHKARMGSLWNDEQIVTNVTYSAEAETDPTVPAWAKEETPPQTMTTNAVRDIASEVVASVRDDVREDIRTNRVVKLENADGSQFLDSAGGYWENAGDKYIFYKNDNSAELVKDDDRNWHGTFELGGISYPVKVEYKASISLYTGLYEAFAYMDELEEWVLIGESDVVPENQFPVSIGSYSFTKVQGTDKLKTKQVVFDSDLKQVLSATNPTFSNAVLAVGLNIDTNSVAILNEIAATFGGFPIEGTATTVGGLLAALAAAAAWLKKNKVGSFASVGGATATVDNGVAKLDNFFTESNSLLMGTIAANSARLALDEDGEIIVTMNTED